jgi:UDP-N-acetylglucosamine 2-epimerase (non-hydrolysing)
MNKVRKVISVVGARPNFIKIAPVHNAFQPFRDKVRHLVCHTGQHFDKNMSDVFFKELQLPEPDYNLGISGGSHAMQTSQIMIEFEKVLIKEKPDMVIVPGDVNSTLAASLVAAKLSIPVAHVESGLRSFDRSMPEEINRIVTDVIADLLFVSESSGLINLAHEGIDEKQVFLVGNVMIDSLVNYLPLIDKIDIRESFKLLPGNYTLVTLHRPSNVDEIGKLKDYLDILNKVAAIQPVVFPVHPRTRTNIEKFDLKRQLNPELHIIDPVGYIDFVALIKNASLIITDSGGIQEESTFLGVQCITCRENTERPVTVEMGTNHLVGTNPSAIYNKTTEILGGNIKQGRIPDLWDGKTAERIAEIIIKWLS